MKDPTKEKWEGIWEQLKGQAKKTWAELTGDEWLHAAGETEERLGTSKVHYSEQRERTVLCDVGRKVEPC